MKKKKKRQRTWVCARMERRPITKLIQEWDFLFLAHRTMYCHLSHQELPKTKLFLLRQKVQLRQAEVWLWVTVCGKRHRETDCDMLEWLEDFSKGLMRRSSKSSGSDRERPPGTPFLSFYHPTFCSRIFRRIQIVKSAGARKLREARQAIVVQGLATKWLQSCPCKSKTPQETVKSLRMFLEAEEDPNVVYKDMSLEFVKACEDLFWNQCTSTPHRSETSSVLVQSGLDEELWADATESYCPLAQHSGLIG